MMIPFKNHILMFLWLRSWGASHFHTSILSFVLPQIWILSYIALEFKASYITWYQKSFASDKLEFLSNILYQSKFDSSDRSNFSSSCQVSWIPCVRRFKSCKLVCFRMNEPLMIWIVTTENLNGESFDSNLKSELERNQMQLKLIP